MSPPSVAGDLPPFGSANGAVNGAANGAANGAVNERRPFFAEFMQRHNSGLMALLEAAENFAVNEVAPSVQRDLNNATLGQVENVNDGNSNSLTDQQDDGNPSQ